MKNIRRTLGLFLIFISCALRPMEENQGKTEYNELASRELLKACAKENPSFLRIKEMLDLKADPNFIKTAEEPSCTPLEWLCAHKPINFESIKILLENNANPDGPERGIILYNVAINQHNTSQKETIKLLVAHKATVDYTDCRNKPMLHAVVKEKPSKEIVALLVDARLHSYVPKCINFKGFTEMLKTDSELKKKTFTCLLCLKAKKYAKIPKYLHTTIILLATQAEASAKTHTFLTSTTNGKNQTLLEYAACLHKKSLKNNANTQIRKEMCQFLPLLIESSKSYAALTHFLDDTINETGKKDGDRKRKNTDSDEEQKNKKHKDGDEN